MRQSSVKKEKDVSDPKQEYERLLNTEVTSTRASWTDFKRQWKKDRRFYGWGRDDREREKRFRDYLKELGERECVKSIVGQRWHNYGRQTSSCSKGRGRLLCSAEGVRRHWTWQPLEKCRSIFIPILFWLTHNQVKKGIQKDSRYDAVGSSSLREELFNTFVKGLGTSATVTTNQNSPLNQFEEAELDPAERKRRAVKEREEQVKMQRSRVHASNEKAKLGIDREEGERLFMYAKLFFYSCEPRYLQLAPVFIGQCSRMLFVTLR